MCCDPETVRVGTFFLLGLFAFILTIGGWRAWRKKRSEKMEIFWEPQPVNPDQKSKTEEPTPARGSNLMAGLVEGFAREGCEGLFKWIACAVGVALLALGGILKGAICSIWVLQMCQ